MKKNENESDRVKESRAVYRIVRTVKDRKSMREAARRMDEFRRRHARDKADKDVVTLIREERER